ncbi:MAG: UDP-N-acetylmuramoyl-tripeptide--D-alanyl-D-alanine ligase [Alphaproteobacteria bacterium]
MDIIWTEDDIKKATRGKIQGKWNISEVSIDSRKANKNSMFIALKGENTDGHNYIMQALDNGASSVLIDHLPSNAHADINYCIVKNTKEGLWDLARYNRNRLKAKIISVTGSIGKTSTKELLKLCFSGIGKTFANYGNYNNDLGVPISISNTPIDTQYAIYEVGMNHSGEITPLTKLIQPDIAIITTIEPIHLEFFNSVEDIARAKAEIFQGLNQNGYVILNKDNAYFDLLVQEAKKLGIRNIISFGKDQDSDCKLLEFKEDHEGSKIKAEIFGHEINYKLKSFGIHFGLNSLAVMGAAFALGCDLNIAANNLGNFKAIKGRGEQHNLLFNNKNITLIDDSYNAGPPSVKAALKVLGNYKGRRKVAILSDMRELGPDSVKIHIDLVRDISDNKIDKIIAVGKYMKELYYNLPLEKQYANFDDVDEVIEVIDKYIEESDVILVKGSLGTQIFKLVEYIITQTTENK